MQPGFTFSRVAAARQRASHRDHDHQPNGERKNFPPWRNGGPEYAASHPLRKRHSRRAAHQTSGGSEHPQFGEEQSYNARDRSTQRLHQSHVGAPLRRQYRHRRQHAQRRKRQDQHDHRKYEQPRAGQQHAFRIGDGVHGAHIVLGKSARKPRGVVCDNLGTRAVYVRIANQGGVVSPVLPASFHADGRLIKI